MKQLLTVLILLAANATFGQDTTNFTIDSSVYNRLMSSGTISPHLATATTVIPSYTLKNKWEPTKILFYGKEINTAILEIKPNGDIYYNPSSFCDCDKCKSFKGMKFLMNFLKH